LTQAVAAERLGISTSYLNLIENGRRSMSAALLLKTAEVFDVDLRALRGGADPVLVGELLEALSDPLFEESGLVAPEVREVAAQNPAFARAMLDLYRAYKAARGTNESLAAQLSEGEEPRPSSLLPSEEVSDLLQVRGNHFAELERVADELRAAVGEDLYPGLVGHLARRRGIRVELARWADDPHSLRRLEGKRLSISELLPTRSRIFELAHQIALLDYAEVIDGCLAGAHLSTEPARALARVALANYLAAATMMPYDAFVRAAKEERYDIDVLGRRFRVGFEQICHRLTTLRRPGSEGVPFHMIRVDAAGNISKRFSASGIRFARFSGACVRWNIFSAFQTPGMVRVQLSRMPNGETYFCIARTIQKDSAGYHAQQPMLAVGLGCEISHAPSLVYADGLSTEDPRLIVPVGVTCRTCERTDCRERSTPSLTVALRVDQNRRGVSLYAPPEPSPSSTMSGR
jgi:hypothetical protein